MKKYLFLLLIIFPGLVAAHGDSTSQEKEFGDYHVEFEYNTLGNIKAGDVAVYNAYLLDSSDKPVSFDSAYIKISNTKGAPILFGTLKEGLDTPGGAHIGGVLRDAGEHTAQVSFTVAGKQIGPLDFNFNVDAAVSMPRASGNNDKAYLYIPAMLGLFGLGAAVGKYGRKTKPE